jgi:hypothetical protein
MKQKEKLTSPSLSLVQVFDHSTNKYTYRPIDGDNRCLLVFERDTCVGFADVKDLGYNSVCDWIFRKK